VCLKQQQQQQQQQAQAASATAATAAETINQKFRLLLRGCCC
jgi:hypothetical protein